MQYFEGVNELVKVSAWGVCDLKVARTTQTEAGNSRVVTHTLSVKVAPRNDGRRGVICDVNELPSAVEGFVPNDKGNVFLGAFVAVRSKGNTRIAFQPAKDWELSRLHLKAIVAPEMDDALLGGEDEGTTIVTDMPF